MRVLTVSNREVKVNTLVSMVNDRLKMVIDGHASQYITVEVGEEREDGYWYNTITLRVSNHSAKKQNNNRETLSFVSDVCNQGFSGMIGNEYLVDDLEDMNTNETNQSGYLSVYSIIEDFINNLELE